MYDKELKMKKVMGQKFNKLTRNCTLSRRFRRTRLTACRTFVIKSAVLYRRQKLYHILHTDGKKYLMSIYFDYTKIKRKLINDDFKILICEDKHWFIFFK